MIVASRPIFSASPTFNETNVLLGDLKDAYEADTGRLMLGATLVSAIFRFQPYLVTTTGGAGIISVWMFIMPEDADTDDVPSPITSPARFIALEHFPVMFMPGTAGGQPTSSADTGLPVGFQRQFVVRTKYSKRMRPNDKLIVGVMCTNTGGTIPDAAQCNIVGEATALWRTGRG